MNIDFNVGRTRDYMWGYMMVLVYEENASNEREMLLAGYV